MYSTVYLYFVAEKATSLFDDNDGDDDDDGDLFAGKFAKQPASTKSEPSKKKVSIILKFIIF